MVYVPFVPDMIARVDADRAGSTVVVPMFFPISFGGG